MKLAAYDSSGNIIGYYDTVDSPPPEGITTLQITDDEWMKCISSHGYCVENGQLVPITPPSDAQVLASTKAMLSDQIDAMADQVYVSIGGPSPGRLAEYQQANADAQSYKAAGYAGDVPPTIACWVTASGMSAKDATDNIIQTASQWGSALTAIRSARLLGKASVNSSNDVAGAQVAASTAIASIQAIGGANQ